jgi:o-succinylbenzoate---CoA ligase
LAHGAGSRTATTACEHARVRRLVVLEARGTSDFVDRLRRVWDHGDAVFPLDPRLPAPARAGVLAAARPDEPVEAGDALVIATSGTTGAPKAAVLTHDAVAASARATSARLGVDPAHDRWLACLPLAHVGGLGVVTRAMHTGTPLTVVPDADAATLAEATEALHCTLVSLVPALLPRVDPTAFRTLLLGGSAMPPDLPPNAVPTYGMTETGGGIVYGGAPLPGVELNFLDGELMVRGPMLLRAYRDGTDPKDAEGWLRTGDAGWWDGAARLQVQGRIGDVIVTGGEKVWPVQVEQVLATHSGVREVIVVGRDDPVWGQRVVARVVATRSDDPPQLDSLRGHVKESLPPWAAPQELELVDVLPRTPSGKLRRNR